MMDYQFDCSVINDNGKHLQLHAHGMGSCYLWVYDFISICLHLLR